MLTITLVLTATVITIHVPFSMINLAEVQLFNAGVQIPAAQLSFEQSSTYRDSMGPYPAGNCKNGNINDYCHTTGTESNPTLTITSLARVDLIIVTNRQDCCQDRIVGATITVTQAGMEQWQDVFSEVQNSYTFSGLLI